MSPKKRAAKPSPRKRVKRKSATPARARGTKLKAAPPAEDLSLRLNIPGGELSRLPVVDERWFARTAMRWSYILSNRERWNSQPGVVAEQETAIRQVASELGITAQHCRKMADVGLVEVDIPWQAEETAWELRIFPWEFLLTAVTRPFRGDRPLTVIRRLRVTGAVVHSDTSRWMHVVSEPGGLAGHYDFTSEKELLKLTLGDSAEQSKLVITPDSATLGERVRDFKPGVVHLSGFDAHQGARLLGDQASYWERQIDGYWLCAEGERRGAAILAAEGVAAAVAGSSPAPTLVVFNLYNSAARMAPLTVAAGAGAALGFQDSFDDALAELFFTTFYRACRGTNWDLVDAFQFAWAKVREHGGPIRGSGVVLWSRDSILDPTTPSVLGTSEARRGDLSDKLSSAGLREVNRESIGDDLAVELKVVPQLNYSLLHNNGAVFEQFRIRKKDVKIGEVNDLTVHVNLHVGADAFPFRMKASIGKLDTHVDLRDAIRLSLASTLSRGIRESIHTSLLVEVCWRDQLLWQETHRVTLLPVDEWRFDPGLDQWLPSFVLPRDPAVPKLIDKAQRYLMALRDDSTAGFDGYQAVDPEDPEEPTVEECINVDMQVRAIWSALLYECPLSYINPPPVFTGSSQRLRTPSDCIEGRRGTCIDLALLLASCLEYVEIYPTIVLLKTHAFPAYWRHDAFHQKFQKVELAPAGEGNQRPRVSSAGQTGGWQFGRDQYREILNAVQRGWLVPLETTLVTGHGNFADAVAEGEENLASRREFESMLDVIYARSDEKTPVTPLPIRRGDP